MNDVVRYWSAVRCCNNNFLINNNIYLECNWQRQALKIFMHLKENLNASELRWYKDIILDSVTHNIIGSGELWPLVVQTSIQLVRCLEGSNPRAKW